MCCVTSSPESDIVARKGRGRGRERGGAGHYSGTCQSPGLGEKAVSKGTPPAYPCVPVKPGLVTVDYKNCQLSIA